MKIPKNQSSGDAIREIVPLQIKYTMVQYIMSKHVTFRLDVIFFHCPTM